MVSTVRYFGSRGSFRITMVQEQREIVQHVIQEIGFDRDLDGRWTIWAKRMPDDDGYRPAFGEEESLGAIIVTDPTVSAFIAMLGELVADPSRFRDEPRFEPPRHA
jgi:hypothetical protein